MGYGLSDGIWPLNVSLNAYAGESKGALGTVIDSPSASWRYGRLPGAPSSDTPVSVVRSIREEPSVRTRNTSLDQPRFKTYSVLFALLRVKRIPPPPSSATTQQRVEKTASPMMSRHFPISVSMEMVSGSSSPSGVSGTFKSRLPFLLTVSISMWIAAGADM